MSGYNEFEDFEGRKDEVLNKLLERLDWAESNIRTLEFSNAEKGKRSTTAEGSRLSP